MCCAAGGSGCRPSSVLSLNFDFQKALNLIRPPKSSINLRFGRRFCRASLKWCRRCSEATRRTTSTRQTARAATLLWRHKSDSKVIRHLAVIASPFVTHGFIHPVIDPRAAARGFDDEKLVCPHLLSTDRHQRATIERTCNEKDRATSRLWNSEGAHKIRIRVCSDDGKCHRALKVADTISGDSSQHK